MITVYVYKQGATITREGEVLAIHLLDGTKQNVRLHSMERLIIYGNVHFTTPTLSLLLRNEIPVSFLTIHGEYKGTLLPLKKGNTILRLKQYDKVQNSYKKLILARRIVYGKLYNSFAFIQSYHRHKPLEQFERYKQITQKLLTECLTAWQKDVIMGYEGFGTRSYFLMYSSLFDLKWNFKKRTKRPPLDPINAMMSLGYTLLGTELAGLIESHGLDASLGMYHVLEYGRQSLALDILEEFRSLVVDRFVLHLATQNIFSEYDFEYDENNGCRFKKESLKNFLDRFNKWLNADLGFKEKITWRQILWRQVERMAQYIDKDIEYMPYIHEDINADSSGL